MGPLLIGKPGSPGPGERAHTHTHTRERIVAAPVKIVVLLYVSIACLTETKSCIILLVKQRASSELVIAAHP